ncbi:MAG: UvrD-helicase domain-containing protein [Desulfovibrio sp.]|uniref:UvrD-helicase domain-containing protein n=1 Tax=Desulfovibrio sp. 7SRBS1 TaxID=3378064 RepID=UPI003B3C12C7
MEQFRADLHIHSKYSRATSKSLTPRNLAAWAKVKGLSVVGTGDFQHPGWLEELSEQLEEDDGTGLLALKSESGLAREIPWSEGYLPHQKTRFILQTEISSIYKRGGKVRKVHNLVFVPNLDAARRFSERLGAVGNIKSDGRPILGLDSRNLLEMVLELDPLAFLVPAHIWTPWFSLFGSKSGFDSIEECFGDLSQHIFALETGLSSDPDMNWHLSALDRFRLISNSDAHSGEKLGREANVFSGDMSYEGILRALRGEGLGRKFLGTVEFFPEEGKYHLDGHRKCGIVMEPEETRSRGGICPVCGKPITVGVLNRVMELADREKPEKPSNQPGFTSLIPLRELMGEILGCGPATKKVSTLYRRAMSRMGSELNILQDAPAEEIAKVSPPLAEAVLRMRAGKVLKSPGFDGQYGVIHVFSDAERAEMVQGKFLIRMPQKAESADLPLPNPVAAVQPSATGDRPVFFNEAQKQAIDAGPEPVLVMAGPGTGKTQTLMGRVEHLLEQGETPRHILAVTFTHRAAAEMRERLARLEGGPAALPRADTLHALAFEYWSNAYSESPVIMSEEAAFKVYAECNPELTGPKLKQAWNELNLSREQLRGPGTEDEAFHRYTKKKEYWNLVDYTDLLEFFLEQIEAKIYSCPYTHVLVDEVQDLSPLQIAVVTALAEENGKGFFAIGDPRQSIYSFRGAVPDVEAVLKAKWPELSCITLQENYRSAPTVLQLAAALFPKIPSLRPNLDIPGEAYIFSAPDTARESAWIGERIRKLIGGTSLTMSESNEETQSPGDIAILVRIKSLIPPLARSLDRVGVPFTVPMAEAFWREPRVQAILAAAGSFLGMALQDGPEELEGVEIPEKILAKGPQGLSAFLEDVRPFDRMFFKSRAFRQLEKGFMDHGGWTGLINWVNLRSELEEVSHKAEKIQIMSIHAAKGLEFQTVFMPALEDGFMPFAGMDFLSGKISGNSGINPAKPDEDEERRLFYVGLTRAKSGLYLSHSARRELYGTRLMLPPSRFLEELPQDLLKASQLVAKTVRQEKSLTLM